MSEAIMEHKETVLFPPWKELVKTAMQDWVPGSNHSHDEVAAILGVDYPSSKYYQFTDRAFKTTTRNGKRIINVHDVGYYVLLPSEYPEAAYEDVHRAGKAARVAHEHVVTAPTKNMDDTTKKRMENIGVWTGRAYSSMVSVAHEIKELAGIERGQKMLEKGAKGKVD